MKNYFELILTISTYYIYTRLLQLRARRPRAACMIA